MQGHGAGLFVLVFKSATFDLAMSLSFSCIMLNIAPVPMEQLEEALD